jgi:hypothetical protein
VRGKYKKKRMFGNNLHSSEVYEIIITINITVKDGCALNDELWKCEIL